MFGQSREAKEKERTKIRKRLEVLDAELGGEPPSASPPPSRSSGGTGAEGPRSLVASSRQTE